MASVHVRSVEQGERRGRQARSAEATEGDARRTAPRFSSAGGTRPAREVRRHQARRTREGGTVRGCPSAGVPRDRCGPQRVSPLAVVAGVDIFFEKKPAEASFPKELIPRLKILFGKEAK